MTVEFKGVSAEPVASMADVEGLLVRAEAARAKASTSMNERSSRSHLLVQLMVEKTNMRTKTIHTSKMVLVDLAGSECVGASGVKGINLREAKHINRSLSALADVLAAIRAGAPHIPFRNSKLTQALSDSLAGNAKVLLFVNIAPLEQFLVEASHSAAFGSSARRIIVQQATSGTAASSPAPASSSKEPATAPASPSRLAGSPAGGDEARASPLRRKVLTKRRKPTTPPDFVF